MSERMNYRQQPVRRMPHPPKPQNPVRSATVELDHSDFTPLPDYDRLLSVLKGNIQLKIGGAEPMELEPGRVAAFDGGVPVESWGRCVDFNLMVRKGKAKGSVEVLSGDRETEWAPGAGDLAVYCAAGAVRLPDWNLEAQAGQTLLCLGFEDGPVKLVCQAGLVMLASVREA